jgi:hypothetical protein
LGCAALRDGAYLLPLEQAPALEALAKEVADHGGTASVMALSPRDEKQKLEILAQFSRADQYAAWHEALRLSLIDLPALTEPEARKRLRSASEALQTLRRIDYYPTAASQHCDAALGLWRTELDSRFSKGEPQAVAGNITRLDAHKFQGKRWATRARPWVDRLACAWLIKRFIDADAQFVWLQDTAKAPRGVLGFDYDGARFTHVGTAGAERVSFEVLLASFSLEKDPRLQAMALTVHYLDAGGIPAPQAAGLEAILSGLREVHSDDDALVQASNAVFDALYAAVGKPPAQN